MTPPTTPSSPSISPPATTHCAISVAAGALILAIGLLIPLLLAPASHLLLLVPLAGLAFALTWTMSHHLGASLAAAGLAPLFTGEPTGAIAGILLLALTTLSVLARSPLPLALITFLLLWNPPATGILLGLAVALLIAWPAPHDTGKRFLPATWSTAVIPLALILALVAMALSTPWWAAPAGVLAGTIARLIDRHPANHRIAQSLSRSALLIAPLPAVLLFLLAALGRLDPASPLRTLAIGWGSLGLGVLLFGLGVGLALLLSARGPYAAIALATFFTAGVLTLVALLGAITDTPRIAAISWPIFAPVIALGAARLAIRLSPPVVWGSLALATLLTHGVKLIPGIG